MRSASDLRADGSDVSSGAGARRHLGLDGLRGLAVAWVVLFHLWPDAVPGGWLGVGLFFTLSGYLVVGLIDTEVSATGSLRLGRFMARRVRRLMPAALLTIASVLLLTAILDDQALREVGFDALTAVLNVFNWRTALDTAGYAAIFESRPEPLAHFWSLAIEEQFYLLFPAAVALTRRTALVVWAMVVAGLVGVVLWWGSADAYVATPVRALEIAAGAGLALAAARFGFVARLMDPEPGPDPGRPRRATLIAGGAIFAVAAGVTVLALARLGPQVSLGFRGGPQLMAFCWVVLVVAAVRDGILSRIMAVGVLRWLGTRSYAIYLFHWPLIELTDWNPVTVVVATLIAAEVSFRLVEMPVRLGSGQQALVLLGAAVVAVALIALAMAVLSNPARAIGERASEADEIPAWALQDPEVSGTETADAPAGSPTDSAAPTSMSPSSTQATESTTTGSATSESPITTTTTSHPATAVPIVTVIGDSSGLHLADGLRTWADSNRAMAVVDHTRVGCSPLISAERPWRARRIDPEADDSIEWWIHDEPCRDDFIEPGTKLVLVVDHVNPQYEHQRSDGSWASILDQDFAADIEDSYRQLVSNAWAVDAQVVFATAPRLLSYHEVGIDHDPRRAEAYNSLVLALVAELRSTAAGAAGPGVAVVDTATELDASGHHGRYGRTDGVHLDFDRSEIFAAEVLGPALVELLESD
ncbi:MAG: acyltransferase [Acidimicrobiaceae bacterium]|nr:acyltransferase [Acidimicrobiaceae bacterium]